MAEYYKWIQDGVVGNSIQSLTASCDVLGLPDCLVQIMKKIHHSGNVLDIVGSSRQILPLTYHHKNSFIFKVGKNIRA